jgi:hypothetical protein
MSPFASVCLYTLKFHIMLSKAYYKEHIVDHIYTLKDDIFWYRCCVVWLKFNDVLDETAASILFSTRLRGVTSKKKTPTFNYKKHNPGSRLYLKLPTF